YFVRLSDDSVTDESLMGWFAQQLLAFKCNPSQLVFEVCQKTIQMHLTESGKVVKSCKDLGCLFAIENFGLGDSPLRILGKMSIDFIKIDGSLMQGITGDTVLQERVRGYIDSAQNKQIQTIAERVDDANTMAVLWQLGVDFVQGYYVHEPEVVIEA
ncbi:MAG: EAL domain-containing protein, partial [Pseudomonadota bacterium]